MKKVLKQFLAVFLVLIFSALFLYIAKKIQKTPDEIFRSEIIGRWRNTSLGSDTYIDFYNNGSCNYHDLDKDNKCLFFVKNRIIIVVFDFPGSPLSSLKISTNNINDIDKIKSAIKLGMEISSINIKNNIMTAKLKAISGARETLAKDIKLKKEFESGESRK